jgi:hypothetical protein
MEPKHVSADNGRDIQLAVHEIAQSWIQRGFCRDCVIRQIVTAAVCVAQDANKWPADAVHEAVDDAYSPGVNHIWHGQH